MRFDQRLAAVTACGAFIALLFAAFAARPAPAAPPAHTGDTERVTLALDRPELPFGESALARGNVRGASAGESVALEWRDARGTWSPIARGLTRIGGDYEIAARIPMTGELRVVRAGLALSAAAGPEPVASPVQRIRVRAAVAVLHRRTLARAGSLVRVSGRVRPATAGRVVLLQRRSGRGWRTIARTRTRLGGTYRLRLRAHRAGSAPLRVRASGSAGILRGAAGAGRLEVLRPALASWYGEPQALACGGTLAQHPMGVAHKTLPCGTLVTVRYRGRQVRVPVIDRGPYAGGREFDLGPGVRAALGFDGVGTVWVDR